MKRMFKESEEAEKALNKNERIKRSDRLDFNMAYVLFFLATIKPLINKKFLNFKKSLLCN